MAYVVDESTAHVGPWFGTIRDRRSVRSWYGLSQSDRARLVEFLRGHGAAVKEVHTHVAVGRVPVCPDEFVGTEYARVLRGRWPWRIDAALKVGAAWWIVECKGECTHHVIGQLYAYRYLWVRDLKGHYLMRSVIACDSADPEMVEVAGSLGIDVILVGVGDGNA